MSIASPPGSLSKGFKSLLRTSWNEPFSEEIEDPSVTYRIMCWLIRARKNAVRCGKLTVPWVVKTLTWCRTDHKRLPPAWAQFISCYEKSFRDVTSELTTEKTLQNATSHQVTLTRAEDNAGETRAFSYPKPPQVPSFCPNRSHQKHNTELESVYPFKYSNCSFVALVKCTQS